MFSIESLSISGYRGRSVPNTFFRRQEETQHLAVVLPGIRYTCQMPLLYYPTMLLLEEFGANVLWVEYAYDKQPDFNALPGSEKEVWLFADAGAACRAALAQRPYEEIALIGKSLGTLAMEHLLTTEASLAEALAIWLTPLLKNDSLRAQIREREQRSLLVIGTEDPHYDPNYLEGVENLVLEGADHSLEIRGHPRQSLRALEEVLQTIQTFVHAHRSP